MKEKTANKPVPGSALGVGKRVHKKSFSYTILEAFMEYRDYPLYKWIKNHPDVSLGLLALWGIIIIFMFFWFIVSRIIQVS